MEQLERCVGIEQRCTMAEHVEARRAVDHLLVGVGAEVHRGLEAGIAEHLDEDRHDVGVDVLEAVDGGVHRLAVLLPHARAVHGESGFGHQGRGLVGIVQTRLVLLLERLDVFALGEGLEIRIERERIDRRDLRALIEDFVDQLAVDRQADRPADVRIAVRFELGIHPQRVRPPVEIAVGRGIARMGGDVGILLQDIADDGRPHVDRGIHLVADQPLGDDVEALAENVGDDDALHRWRLGNARFHRPPVLAQVVDFLLRVPGDEIIGARMRQFGAAGIGVDVRLALEAVLGHDRNAGVEFQRQHLEHEARRRDLEGDVDGQIVDRGDGRTVVPLGGRIELDLQRGEVVAGIVHAFGQPGDVFALEDAEIHQRLPHEGVAFLVGIAGQGPGVGDADGRGGRNAPAEHQRLVAGNIGQRGRGDLDRIRLRVGGRGRYQRRRHDGGCGPLELEHVTILPDCRCNGAAERRQHQLLDGLSPFCSLPPFDCPGATSPACDRTLVRRSGELLEC